MLYELLAADDGFFRLFNYTTFRTGGAIVTAFLFSVLCGDWVISQLRQRQGKGQPIRDLSLQAQAKAEGASK